MSFINTFMHNNVYLSLRKHYRALVWHRVIAIEMFVECFQKRRVPWSSIWILRGESDSYACQGSKRYVLLITKAQSFTTPRRGAILEGFYGIPGGTIFIAYYNISPPWVAIRLILIMTEIHRLYLADKFQISIVKVKFLTQLLKNVIRKESFQVS